MAISGTSSGTTNPAPPSSVYSVLRGALFTFQFRGLDDLTHLFATTIIKPTAPANYSDGTNSHTHGANSVYSVQSTAQSDGTFSGFWRDAAGPGITGWNVGSHLWWMIFDQAAVPSGVDVPVLTFDLGVIIN